MPLAFGLTVVPDPPYQRLISILATRRGAFGQWTVSMNSVLSMPWR